MRICLADRAKTAAHRCGHVRDEVLTRAGDPGRGTRVRTRFETPTSAEVRAFVARRPTADDRAALADWIEQAARMTTAGLGDYQPDGG
jgi:hypothetical protein